MASKRKKMLIGAAVAAATAVALAAGIGTASAYTRPAASPKPSKSATVKPSTAKPTTVKPTTAKPTATKSASATPSASKSATPTKTTASPAATTPTSATGTWTAPTGNAGFDYQIGGAYTPPSGVTVVSRDREASPAAGLYNVCYVNAFQAQPGDESWWKTNHADLLLRDKNGALVIDEDWNELMFDISTAAKRTALMTVVGPWIDGCKTSGFQAVEFDNLDSYTRSQNLLTQAQAIEFATLLSDRAHTKGLASGQKNLAELTTANAKKIGFDFAVAEECGAWDECDAYTATYGNKVLVIEYSQEGFTKACKAHGSTLSIVLRDVDVSTKGSGSYVFQTC
ncbi:MULTISPECIES: endo alpha-1,4 polygalactosaminidase [Actinoplanes]|uniref:endo alpha-1,4 polygalactosaminidase n=1 Tax=Actinoplanes TaxID=1865 RepID=UPI0005F2DD27|nr:MULTISPECIES: endo alpha-1,4 polygalactosaminidase [Actinoplanes]GLY05969.1 hypothetical protein Acsp01_63480 [Actinoplanes sp. NBRC 101535]